MCPLIIRPDVRPSLEADPHTAPAISEVNIEVTALSLLNLGSLGGLGGLLLLVELLDGLDLLL